MHACRCRFVPSSSLRNRCSILGVDTSFDQRAMLKGAYPSYGPDWDAAIEWGVDVSLLERNLRLSVEERLLQLHDMTRLRELLTQSRG